MQPFIALLLRTRPVILAGLAALTLAACSSQPAQLGTPEYALQRLFGDRPYRSTDQLLEAHRPRPVEPAAPTAAPTTPETPAGEGDVSGSESGSGATEPTGSPMPLTVPSAPAVPPAVTIIELNEWEPYPIGGAYGYAYPSYHYPYPYPYYHYPRAYRPFYNRLYGPGGFARCYGACGGLSLSIGGSKSRFRLNTGAFESSSSSKVFVRPPYRDPPRIGAPRSLLPPPRTLR